MFELKACFKISAPIFPRPLGAPWTRPATSFTSSPTRPEFFSCQSSSPGSRSSASRAAIPNPSSTCRTICRYKSSDPQIVLGFTTTLGSEGINLMQRSYLAVKFCVARYQLKVIIIFNGQSKSWWFFIFSLTRLQMSWTVKCEIVWSFVSCDNFHWLNTFDKLYKPRLVISAILILEILLGEHLPHLG